MARADAPLAAWSPAARPPPRRCRAHAAVAGTAHHEDRGLVEYAVERAQQRVVAVEELRPVAGDRVAGEYHRVGPVLLVSAVHHVEEHHMRFTLITPIYTHHPRQSTYATRTKSSRPKYELVKNGVAIEDGPTIYPGISTGSTLLGQSHLEFLGSRDGILKAKAEVFHYLSYLLLLKHMALYVILCLRRHLTGAI